MSHSPTGRDCIRTSAQAAAAVALAPAFAACSHASVLGAKDSIGVGIMGIDIRAEILLRAPGPSRTRIVEVADVYETHFDWARELVGPDIRAGRDYKKLLDNKDVQAVDHRRARSLAQADRARHYGGGQGRPHPEADDASMGGRRRDDGRRPQGEANPAGGSQWVSVEDNAQVKMANRVMAMGAINTFKNREVPDQMSPLVEY